MSICATCSATWLIISFLKEIPEDKYLLSLLLILDIINSILREIIALVSTDDRTAGIVTVVFYGLLSLLLIFLSLFGLICSYDKNLRGWILQLVSIVFYFYGDNIGYISQRYGEALGCGDRCIENNRIAAVVMLGSAIIVLHFSSRFPTSKDDLGWWYYTLGMIAVLVQIDTVFTIVAIMAQTSNYCSLTDESLGWSFFVICTIIGIAAIIFSSIHVDDEITTAILFTVVILLSISLPLYILSDNEQPIDCVWGCDSYADNTTTIIATDSGMNCNMKANSGMRLGLMSVAGLLVLLSGILLGCEKWKIKGVV